MGTSLPPPRLRNEIPPEMIILENIYQNIRLYNIAADPTEHNELSAERPDVVRQLLNRLDYYYKNSVSPMYPALDVGSNPELHDGMWAPWQP